MRLLSYMAPGFPHSLFETLAEVAGIDVAFDEMTSGPADGTDPFGDGEAEFGWICSTSFVHLALNSPSPSVGLVGVAWVPDDPDSDGRPVYFGDLAVAASSDACSLDDLAGARIGCNDPISLSGHHALRIALGGRGHDPDLFADLVFTGSHQASLDGVIAGDLDAAVVDSVVRSVRARSHAAVADLRVIDRLGPWPVQPMVAAAQVPEHTVAAIRDRLLAANDEPRVQRELAAAGLQRLVLIGPDHYRGIGAALTRA